MKAHILLKRSKPTENNKHIPLAERLKKLIW